MKICERCGFEGEDVKEKPGKLWVQIALFIVFFPAWLVYGFWRIMATKKLCPSCRAPASSMVSLDSPLGKRLKHQFASEEHALEERMAS